MIVLLFNSSIVSGPETLVLPAFAKSNWPVEVWFLEESRLPIDPKKDPVIYAKSLGLKVRIIEVNSRWDNQSILKLTKILGEVKPSIVHAHDVKASIYLGMASLLLKFKKYLNFKINSIISPKLVTTHHGVRARFSLKLRAYERLYCFIAGLLFDQIYAVCSSDALLLKKTWFIPSKKIKLHLNGVTRDFITKTEKNKFRIKYLEEWSKILGHKFNPLDFYIGVVGRLSFEKNHRYIIEIFNDYISKFKINSNENKKYLFIFGSGPLEVELKEMVYKLGLSEVVYFLGYQANMAEKISALDLLLSYSLFEGLPINLIEAGWAGVPVIANDIDGNRDLVPNSSLGILLNPILSRIEIVTKLQAVISDKELIDSMGESFQKHVQANFSQDNWLLNLKKYYLELGLSIGEFR